MKQNFTVRQGALDGVAAFLSVAQHRNFRKAAAELAVTPSAISQAVRALEARIGAALFIRTTRSVGLTEAGQRFLARAKPAFEELVAASEVARDLGQRPAGLLRLTAPRAVMPHLLDLIGSFAQAYPEVEVEISASADLVDIAAGGFDAGIRLGQFIEADMIAVRLTRARDITCGGIVPPLPARHSRFCSGATLVSNVQRNSIDRSAHFVSTTSSIPISGTLPSNDSECLASSRGT